VYAAVQNWLCHVNRQDTQGSVSAVFQAATLAFPQTPNAPVRNRLNVDLMTPDIKAVVDGRLDVQKSLGRAW
jgi:hypothetical protein